MTLPVKVQKLMRWILECELVLPSVPYTTLFLRLPTPGDISRVFHCIKFHPYDYSKLHQMCDKFYSFGFGYGGTIFQKDAISFITRQTGHSVIRYIDGVVGCGHLGPVDEAFQDL